MTRSPTHPPRAHTAVVALLGLVVVAAIVVLIIVLARPGPTSSSQAEPGANGSEVDAPAPATSVAEAVEAEDPAGPAVVQRDAEIDAIAALKDASLDTWTTEVFNDRASAQFKKLDKYMNRTEDAPSLSSLVTDDIRVSRLRPTDRETVFEDEACSPECRL